MNRSYGNENATVRPINYFIRILRKFWDSVHTGRWIIQPMSIKASVLLFLPKLTAVSTSLPPISAWPPKCWLTRFQRGSKIFNAKSNYLEISVKWQLKKQKNLCCWRVFVFKESLWKNTVRILRPCAITYIGHSQTPCELLSLEQTSSVTKWLILD
jgi:hypothetical protein